MNAVKNILIKFIDSTLQFIIINIQNLCLVGLSIHIIMVIYTDVTNLRFNILQLNHDHNTIMLLVRLHHDRELSLYS